MMDASEAAEIVARLKSLAESVAPEAALVAKYGGTVVEAVAGRPETQFCGFFVSKHHVSLEFTNGVQLEDPDKLLEGAGKHRRHVKLRRSGDLADKRCEDFLRQAHILQAAAR